MSQEISIFDVFRDYFRLHGEGEVFNVKAALGVPALLSAVNFLSGTIAGLPLHVYRKTDDGREKVKGGLAPILHDAVNDSCSSFQWRKYTFERVFTTGRGLTYIERSARGRVINLWPLNPAKVSVQRKNGQVTYKYTEGDIQTVYEARDIIDIPYMLDEDMLSSISPIHTCESAISLAISATNYGKKFFENGGVPPFVLTGNFKSGASLNRASNDLQEAIKRASKENRLALTIPENHEIKSVGISPEDGQLLELKRFCVEEIARIYSIPPTFLQDLTNGTFSNTEQQDLHFVKHTIKRWIEQIEQELNLKLFGRNNTSQYVEFNVDGLLRGDFKTRMEGYATAIQNGIMKPNEARDTENRPKDPEGDRLLIQGATVPLGQQSTGANNE